MKTMKFKEYYEDVKLAAKHANRLNTKKMMKNIKLQRCNDEEFNWVLSWEMIIE